MNADNPSTVDNSNAADLEQLEQENALFPWLADDSMADSQGDDDSWNDYDNDNEM